MFRPDQLERYSRHLLLDGVGAAGQRRLGEARVLVVGAGGLGSPALLYLAAAGIGTVGIADGDAVELSNLQRQVLHGSGDLGRAKTASAADRLRDLNPDIELTVIDERLDATHALERLASFDLVLDGSDNFPTRYLLSDACTLLGTPLVYGAVQQFEGQLSLLCATDAALPGGRGPCYRCLFPDPPPPGSVPSCAEAGVLGALAGVIGSLMAVEAVKTLLGLGETLAGTLLHLDALAARSHRFEVRRRADCPACGDAPSIDALQDYEAFCGVV